MARNSSGTYTVPNTFTVGSTANPDRVNENFADLGTEITNSLPRDGRAAMTGQFQAAIGTLSQPGLSFVNDGNSGFMWKSDGVWAFVVNGVEAFTLTSGGVKLSVAGASIFDKGIQSTGTVTFDYDDGAVQKATMNGSITMLPADIPEGQDLQVNLAYASGTLTFSGVARWVLGAAPPSANFADTGIDGAALVAGATYQFVFSKVGSDTVGYVARVK